MFHSGFRSNPEVSGSPLVGPRKVGLIDCVCAEALATRTLSNSPCDARSLFWGGQWSCRRGAADAVAAAGGALDSPLAGSRCFPQETQPRRRVVSRIAT